MVQHESDLQDGEVGRVCLLTAAVWKDGYGERAKPLKYPVPEPQKTGKEERMTVREKFARRPCPIGCASACRNCKENACLDRVAPYVMEILVAQVEEMDTLKHCGMRDMIACRHCHEKCEIRLSPRTF
jgi:hypothetical protein